MLWFAIRLVCFHSIFTTFLKDHASQILSKGPISTKELQEYSKFGAWHVEFYGYVCTSSAEADWRKKDLVLQGFIVWTKSMAWPAHLHTQECLVKSLFFVAQMPPGCKPGRLLGQAGALPQEECALI